MRGRISEGEVSFRCMPNRLIIIMMEGNACKTLEKYERKAGLTTRGRVLKNFHKTKLGPHLQRLIGGKIKGEISTHEKSGGC